jgi:uncharacterized membrane protein
VARAVAEKLPKLTPVALVLQLAAAGIVAIAAHRGGKLVYHHAAAVRLHGAPVLKGPPAGP